MHWLISQKRSLILVFISAAIIAALVVPAHVVYPQAQGAAVQDLTVAQSQVVYAQDQGTAIQDPTVAQWTFMVYIDADNNLYDHWAQGDIQNLASPGSTDKVNIVYMLDKPSENGTGGWYYWVSQKGTIGGVPVGGRSVLQQTLPEPNMGDPQTLENFIRWAQSNYPAKKYALVLWDHGAGRCGVCADWTSGDEEILTTPELKTALSDLACSGWPHINLISFMACSMASIEVAYQIKDYCDVMVGSEEYTSGNSPVPYDQILSALEAHPWMSPAQLGTMMCRKYHAAYGPDAGSVTYSAIDLTKMDRLAISVKRFANIMREDAYSTTDGIYTRYTIMQDRAASVWPQYNVADLFDFAAKVSGGITPLPGQPYVPAPLDVRLAARRVMAAVNAAVICNVYGSPDAGCHGLHIYFPVAGQTYDDDRDFGVDYGSLDFVQTTGWQTFLNSYLSWW